MVVNLSQQYSLLSDWVGELRNTEVQGDRMRFRRNLERIGEVAAFEISKELAFAEEKLRNDIKATVTEEVNKVDYATKKDIKDLEIKITQLDTKIEKGFKEIIIWVVSAMVVIGGLTIGIIKLF